MTDEYHTSRSVLRRVTTMEGMEMPTFCEPPTQEELELMCRRCVRPEDCPHDDPKDCWPL